MSEAKSCKSLILTRIKLRDLSTQQIENTRIPICQDILGQKKKQQRHTQDDILQRQTNDDKSEQEKNKTIMKKNEKKKGKKGRRKDQELIKTHAKTLANSYPGRHTITLKYVTGGRPSIILH